ncbi:MAG: type II toxin-antitoxin system HigB family toxin [Bacteroidales bacterium]|jgi:mRNA interferase HigB|nr:type II toxin-antitoxin system HigB family toxin [Bacteroidales bacterium]
MLIMNPEILDELTRKHAITLKPITRWVDIVKAANWQSIHDVWRCFADADDVGNRHIVFNIKGNNYRIVAIVLFVGGVINIRWAGTHEEYDRIPDCSVL